MKLVKTIVISLLTIWLCGCSFIYEVPRGVIAADYLKTKYGIDTEYASPRGGSPTLTASSISSFTMREVGDTSGNEIYVNVQRLNGNKYLVSDNYLAVKYEQEIEDRLNDIANDIFGYGNAIVFYEPTEVALSPELNLESTLDEVMSDESLTIIADMVVDTSRIDNSTLNNFANEMYNNGIYALFKVYAMDANTLLDITSENISNINSKQSKDFYIISIDRSGVEIEVYR